MEGWTSMHRASRAERVYAHDASKANGGFPQVFSIKNVRLCQFPRNAVAKDGKTYLLRFNLEEFRASFGDNSTTFPLPRCRWAI
jgi:hypothetical protein